MVKARIEVKIGREYEDRWHNKRIPLLRQLGDDGKITVMYVKKFGDGVWEYIPYVCAVTEKTFLKTYQATGHCCSNATVLKMQEVCSKIMFESAKLYETSTSDLQKIIKLENVRQ